MYPDMQICVFLAVEICSLTIKAALNSLFGDASDVQILRHINYDVKYRSESYATLDVPIKDRTRHTAVTHVTQVHKDLGLAPADQNAKLPKGRISVLDQAAFP